MKHIHESGKQNHSRQLLITNNKTGHKDKHKAANQHKKKNYEMVKNK